VIYIAGGQMVGISGIMTVGVLQVWMFGGGGKTVKAV